MSGPSSFSSESDRQREINAVAALVKLLSDSGFQMKRIEAAIGKPATAANSSRASDGESDTVFHGRGRRPKAA